MKENKLNNSIIEYLEGLADGNIPNSQRTGVCNNLSRFVHSLDLKDKPNNNYYKLIHKFAPSWEHFNGDLDFPIGGTEEYYEDKDNSWKGTSGIKRRDLCQHIANCLRKDPLGLEEV